MKFIHSLGFLGLGFLMYKLPQLAPGLCPVDIFGNSVRATWLHLMGVIQIAIGGSYVMRGVASLAADWLQRWPEEIAAAMAMENTPTPQQPAPALPGAMPQPEIAQVIPGEFKPVWSEQQPAAA